MGRQTGEHADSVIVVAIFTPLDWLNVLNRASQKSRSVSLRWEGTHAKPDMKKVDSSCQLYKSGNTEEHAVSSCFEVATLICKQRPEGVARSLAGVKTSLDTETARRRI